MGSSQSLSSFIFPQMSESDLKTFVNSLNSSLPEKLKYEKTLGRGRVSWSMLVREERRNLLLLMRIYAKKSDFSGGGTLTKKKVNNLLGIGSKGSLKDPLSVAKLSFIHELYFEKCSQLDFVLKPLMINDSNNFLVIVRPFSRFNLPDRITTYIIN